MSTLKVINLVHPSGSNNNAVFDANGNVIVAGTVSGSTPFSMRNRIINGGMDVWQRGTSGFTTNYAYCADRWAPKADTTFTSAAQSTDVPTGFKYSLTVTGTGYAGILQRIESINCYGLSGQNVTVSFWAKQTVGAGASSIVVLLTYPTAGADNYGSGVTQIGSAQYLTGTSSWAQYSVTFSNLPSGALNGLSPYILANVAGSSTILITGVQLELGSVATPFERRPYGMELALCQRYYQKTFPQTFTPGDNVTLAGAIICSVGALNNFWGVQLTYPVTMRTTPSFTFYSPQGGTAGYWRNGGNTASSQPTLINPSESRTGIFTNNGSAWTPAGSDVYYVHATLSAEL